MLTRTSPAANALPRADEASLGPDLFLHAGFPTIEHDAVFFGPDTYRFARFIDAAPTLDAAGCARTYDEIDPDVFGEELERPAYRHAHRIAAVGMCATNPAGASNGR